MIAKVIEEVISAVGSFWRVGYPVLGTP